MKPINFKKFSDEDLLESLHSIDKEKFAENYRRLVDEIACRGYSISKFKEIIGERREKADFNEHLAESGIDPGYFNLDGKYISNKVPFERLCYSVLIPIALVSYGIYGIAKNDLYLPGRRGRGIHLHDFSVTLCFLSFVVFSIMAISVFIDHFDKRNNEKVYFKFQKKAALIAVAFFILAITWEFFSGF